MLILFLNMLTAGVFSYLNNNRVYLEIRQLKKEQTGMCIHDKNPLAIPLIQGSQFLTKVWGTSLSSLQERKRAQFLARHLGSVLIDIYLSGQSNLLNSLNKVLNINFQKHKYFLEKVSPNIFLYSLICRIILMTTRC